MKNEKIDIDYYGGDDDDNNLENFGDSEIILLDNGKQSRPSRL